MRILIDLDSITANLLEPWLALYNKDYNDNLTIDKITSWDTHKYTKPECGERVYEYLKRPGFFYGLEPLPGAVEWIEILHKIGHQIYMVTAAPDGSATEKVHWVGKYLPFLNAKKQTVVCYHKEIIEADVLIDDSPRNLIACKTAHPEMHVMSIAYPYNAGIGDFRAASWQDTEAAWSAIVKEIVRIRK